MSNLTYGAEQQPTVVNTSDWWNPSENTLSQLSSTFAAESQSLWLPSGQNLAIRILNINNHHQNVLKVNQICLNLRSRKSVFS